MIINNHPRSVGQRWRPASEPTDCYVTLFPRVLHQPIRGFKRPTFMKARNSILESLSIGMYLFVQSLKRAGKRLEGWRMRMISVTWEMAALQTGLLPLRSPHMNIPLHSRRMATYWRNEHFILTCLFGSYESHVFFSFFPVSPVSNTLFAFPHKLFRENVSSRKFSRCS